MTVLLPRCRRTDVAAALAAALNAWRTEAAVIHDEGRARLAAQELDLIVHAEAAAVPACAARALAQRKAAE